MKWVLRTSLNICIPTLTHSFITTSLPFKCC